MRLAMVEGQWSALGAGAKELAVLPQQYMPKSTVDEMTLARHEHENITIVTELSKAVEGGCIKGEPGHLNGATINSAPLTAAIKLANTLQCRTEQAVWIYEVAEALLDLRKGVKAGDFSRLQKLILAVRAMDESNVSVVAPASAPMRPGGRKRRPSAFDMIPGVGVSRASQKHNMVSSSRRPSSSKDPHAPRPSMRARSAAASPDVEPVEFYLSDSTRKELQLVQDHLDNHLMIMVCVCVCVSLCLCVSVSLCLCVSVCLCVCLCVHVPLTCPICCVCRTSRRRWTARDPTAPSERCPPTAWTWTTCPYAYTKQSAPAPKRRKPPCFWTRSKSSESCALRSRTTTGTRWRWCWPGCANARPVAGPARMSHRRQCAKLSVCRTKATTGACGSSVQLGVCSVHVVCFACRRVMRSLTECLSRGAAGGEVGDLNVGVVELGPVEEAIALATKLGTPTEASNHLLAVARLIAQVRCVQGFQPAFVFPYCDGV